MRVISVSYRVVAMEDESKKKQESGNFSNRAVVFFLSSFLSSMRKLNGALKAW